MVHQEPLVLLPNKNKNKMVTLLVDSPSAAYVCVCVCVCVGTQSEELSSKTSIFLISLFSFILLFKQEGLSGEIRHISAFLQRVTDDSTTTDDAGGEQTSRSRIE